MAKAVNKVIYDGDTLIDLTADDVAEANVLNGKKFHKATGASATGSMTNNGAVSGTISTKAGTYTIPAGYHNGSGSVAISSTEQAKIISSNIKSGVTILGVAGSASTGKPEQTKSVTATTTAQTVSPDSGYTLSSVTVNPQTHSTTYTPTANTSNNNMGANHNYRYIDTSGLYRQSGTLNFYINGTSTTNVSGSNTDVYKTINVSVPIPTPEIIACFGPLRVDTSTTYVKKDLQDWQTLSLAGQFYDPNYFTFSNGGLIVKKAGTYAITIYTDRGRTSSGTNTFSGGQVRINGTTIASAYNSSENASYRGYHTLAVGDTIVFYTRSSSTTQGYGSAGFCICTDIGIVAG